MSTIHPLIQDGLNPEQLHAVLQDTNCVIAAGAGSGKTFVLARRFAHLVIDCDMTVDSILTLTFTKKAASEMYQRIYKTLKEIAVSPQSQGLVKERAQNAVANFHRARIQTIDSFCASIVRSASRFYGIRPDFAIDNKAVKEFTHIEAQKFMLAHRTNTALQELTAMGRFEDNAESVFARPILAHSNIAYPLNFTKTIEKQIIQVLDEWHQQISLVFSHRKLFEEAYTDCTELFQKLEDFFPDKAELTQYFSIQQDHAKDSETQGIFYKELYARILSFFDTLYIIQKKRKNKEIGSALEEIRSAYTILSSLAHYIRYFPQMLKIIPLLEDFQSVYTEWKRSSGNLTFADVSSLALRVLLEHPEVRKSEKNGISTIMIDEFQDNNEMQRDMLFLLAEHPERMDCSLPTASELCPNKLFFVGDEKQSIYLFRGADVSVFRKLKDDLNSDDLSLSINYRSHPQLLAAFNTLFGGYEYTGAQSSLRESFEAGLQTIKNGKSIFIQTHQLLEGQKIRPFEAEYRCLYAPPLHKTDDKTTTHTEKSPDTPRIHFCLLDTSSIDDNDPSIDSLSTEQYAANDNSSQDDTNIDNEENLAEAETLAIFTAKKIATICGFTQKSTQKAAYEPKDIALLFRSYSKQSLYEKHLRRRGIPYVTESIVGFFGDAPVNDIFNLIRLIVYPQDATAFGTVLRSPFVRLTHQESAACLLPLGRDTKKEHDILFCEKNAELLDKDAKIRYVAGLERYNRLRDAASTVSCAHMISLLWYNEGYRYETMWNIDAALFAELYDYLFELARIIDEEGGNLSHLADYLSELAEKDERLNDMDIPLDRPGAVRLMSIHKSKGLEFPVVFLCGASSRGRANKLSDKVYINSTWGASLNFPPSPDIKDCPINYFFTLMSTISAQKEEAELRRLLYVALTRAEKELYITASFSLNKTAKGELQNELQNQENPCDTSTLLYAAMSILFTEKVSSACKKISEKTLIRPEYSIPNNTLFAFLLPLIAQFKGQNAPFTLEDIPSITRSELQRVLPYTKKRSLYEVCKKTQPIFENAAVHTTPIIQSPYRSPSKLDTTYDKTTCIQVHNPAYIENPLPELDKIINSIPHDNFTPSHFGIIAHAFTEAALTNKKPLIPTIAISALSPTQLKTICTLAQKMADTFIQSPLGKEAKTAKWCKNEYTFKLLLKSPTHTAQTPKSDIVIVNGTIDLLYERADGTLIIVDYKTDAIENPTIHLLQLAAYRRAGAIIRNTSINTVQCYLHYLRTGHTVDITTQTTTVNLENAVFGF